MKIIGIDPGIGRCGFAIIEHTGKDTLLRECGCIVTQPGEPEAKRLIEIHKDLNYILHKWEPEVAAIESLFFAVNAKTAMTVGQARGVILLTLAEHNLKLIEVTPLQVKMSVTGYGKATKEQIQTMIVKLLKLKKVPKPDDAADAAAIAWSGLGRTRY